MRFSPDAYNEIDTILDKTQFLPEGRESVSGITIDGPDSRDLDDAIDVEVTSDGFIIYVSISDVSEFINPGSAIYGEALERVNTIYLRNGNIPMIPRELSENRLSMLEDQTRYALTFVIKLDKDLQVNDFQIQRTIFKSRRKFNYKEVDNIIDSNPADPDFRLLNNCYTVARMLLDKRQQNGALIIYDLKNLIYTNEEGQIEKMNLDDAHKSYIIIQEFMILTNMCTAEYAAKNELLFLYRNHTVRQSVPSRDDILEQLKMATINMNTLDALRKRITLWFNRAYYEPVLKGHYGLNVPAYSHVTSPIRRFPDLINHYLLKAQIFDTDPVYSFEDLLDITSAVNAKIDESKEKIKEYLKNKASAITSVQIKKAGDDYSRFSNTEFKRALKNLTKLPAITGEIENAINARLLNSEPRVEHLYIILFESNESDPAWIRLRSVALNITLTTQGTGAQMLNILVQNEKLSSLSFACRNHENGFVARVVAAIEGEMVSTPSYYYSPSKKSAQQIAANEYLKLFIESRLVPFDKSNDDINPEKDFPENTPEPDIISEPENAEDNYVGKLGELCNGKSFKTSPMYNFASSGPDHFPVIKCTCNLMVDSHNLMTEGVANNKKSAKQIAAKSMIDTIYKNSLNSIFESTAEEDTQNSLAPADIDIDENYVGNLNDKCLGASIPLPKYLYQKTGPHHMPVIACSASLIFSGELITGEGVATNKKNAKQLAAREILKILENEYFVD